MRRMQQMAGQMGMFNPMAIPFGAYGAYAQAVSRGSARRVGWGGGGGSPAHSAQSPREQRLLTLLWGALLLAQKVLLLPWGVRSGEE